MAQTERNRQAIVVWLNGEPRQLASPCTLSEAIAQWQLPGGGFAVAVNEAFIPRADYADTPLQSGDRVEVLQPMQGG